MIGENLTKTMELFLLMFYLLKKKKYLTYVSKCNSKCVKQIAFLMNPNGAGRHYHAVKKLGLLRGIMFKHHGDCYSLNCLNSFGTADKSHKFCLIEKINGYKNNPESSSTTKVSKQIVQCLQYHHLKVQKVSIMYTERKIV